MITLLSALLGFFGAAFPDLIKLFRDSQDRKHELAILAIQIESQKQGHTQRIEEINANADIAESAALNGRVTQIGIKWVDALNGTVRAIITYSFFLLYTLTKCAQFYLMIHGTPELPWQETMTIGQGIIALWSMEDQAIFSTIIAFWFGSRQINKMRR